MFKLFVPYKKWRKEAEEKEAALRKLMLIELRAKKKNLLTAPLVSVDFDTNIMEIEIPLEVVKRGFSAGVIHLDLSDVQKNLNVKNEAEENGD